jgi:hypothetical protein
MKTKMKPTRNAAYGLAVAVLVTSALVVFPASGAASAIPAPLAFDLITTNPDWDILEGTGDCISGPQAQDAENADCLGVNDWVGGETCYHPYDSCTRYGFNRYASAYKMAWCVAGTSCQTDGIIALTNREKYEDPSGSTFWRIIVRNGVNDKADPASWPEIKYFVPLLASYHEGIPSGSAWGYICPNKCS